MHFAKNFLTISGWVRFGSICCCDTVRTVLASGTNSASHRGSRSKVETNGANLCDTSKLVTFLVRASHTTACLLVVGSPCAVGQRH